MISFILPAFNEEAHLAPLVDKIVQLANRLNDEYQILVVDDGSRDATPEIAASLEERHPLQLMRHETNMGLHQTIWNGLRWAASISGPDDIIVTMDADNTHDPDHFLEMAPLLAQGYDVVIASRYQDGAQEIGLTKGRRILSRGANTMLRLVMPIPGVKDFTCGFRAYRAGIVQKALEHYGDEFIQARSFAAMTEILLKLRPLGIKAAEMPLVLRYDQKEGPSKMRISRTILDYGRIVAGIWWEQTFRKTASEADN